MPITSSTVSEDLAKKGGKRLVLYRAVDHAGQHHMHHEFIDGADNADAKMAAWVSDINRYLVEAELNDFLDAARRGEDVTAKPVTDVTREQAVRHVFRTLLRSDNPRDVVRLLAIRDWLRANFTVAQIRTILGITSARLTALNARLDALAPAKDQVLSDKPDEL